MSQIISIHVGGAGVKVGLDFWQQLSQQYKTDSAQQSTMQHSHRLYSETVKGQHVPKAIFIDTDVRSINMVNKSPLQFDPAFSLGNGSSCFNLFSQGYYGSGCFLIDPFIQCVRKQAQKTDLLSGFILTSSSVGGAGSGVSANVLGKLRQHYCDRIVEDFRIMPGIEADSTYRNLDPLQVYNIVLRTHHDISNADMTYCMQNSAAATILGRKGNIHNSFSDLNKYFAKCLKEHVSWYVEPGTLNTNQRKRAVSMIPFPRIKNFCCSLSDEHTKNYLESALSHHNKLMHHETAQETAMFSMSVDVRDNWTSQNEINQGVKTWLTNTSNSFRDWIPNGLKVSIGSNGSRPPRAWVLYNGQNNIEWLKKICQLFTGQFRRRAFLYHYTHAGMDEMQFTEAESNCNDMVSEYIPWGTYSDEQEGYWEEG